MSRPDLSLAFAFPPNMQQPALSPLRRRSFAPDFPHVRNREGPILLYQSSLDEPVSPQNEEKLRPSLPGCDSDQQVSTNLKDHFNLSPKSLLSDLWSQIPPPDSIILLNLVAIIWGSQHAVIKTCVSDLDPSSFSLVRFFLGALIATPGWLMSYSKGENPVGSTSPTVTWRWGIEMGLWMFLGYAFQAIGLGSTTAQRSGFLLYLNVKFVPFFAFLLLGREISVPTWASAAAAVLGTALLAYDGTSLELNHGDLWSIAAAAASAMFILRLEPASSAVHNAAALNAACLWFVAAASLVWSASLGLVSFGNIVDTIQSHPLELLYLSAVTTALANWIQTKAQKNVTAERASVIYAMDPVWGAIWSNILLGETLSAYGVSGAALITVAAATNAFLDLGTRKPESQP